MLSLRDYHLPRPASLLLRQTEGLLITSFIVQVTRQVRFNVLQDLSSRRSVAAWRGVDLCGSIVLALGERLQQDQRLLSDTMRDTHKHLYQQKPSEEVGKVQTGLPEITLDRCGVGGAVDLFVSFKSFFHVSYHPPNVLFEVMQRLEVVGVSYRVVPIGRSIGKGHVGEGEGQPGFAEAASRCAIEIEFREVVVGCAAVEVLRGCIFFAAYCPGKLS